MPRYSISRTSAPFYGVSEPFPGCQLHSITRPAHYNSSHLATIVVWTLEAESLDALFATIKEDLVVSSREDTFLPDVTIHVEIYDDYRE